MKSLKVIQIINAYLMDMSSELFATLRRKAEGIERTLDAQIGRYTQVRVSAAAASH